MKLQQLVIVRVEQFKQVQRISEKSFLDVVTLGNIQTQKTILPALLFGLVVNVKEFLELFVGEGSVLGHGIGSPMAPAQSDIFLCQLGNLANV